MVDRIEAESADAKRFLTDYVVFLESGNPKSRRS